MNDLLVWLQNYYQAQCDGEWEHQHGFSIDNVDNPGWCVKFDLEHTEVENLPFEGVKDMRTENDWIICFVENKIFRGSGGPQNLTEILTVFRRWVESSGSPTPG